MTSKRTISLAVLITSAIAVAIWWRAPLTFGQWSKQTAFVWLTDAFLEWSADTAAHAMWIDDDSGEGVFMVKNIGDSLGIKPCFAVVAANMDNCIADSLAAWQRAGYGIVLHGLRHESWKNWDEATILSDINRSRKVLAHRGFDTLQLQPIIVPPHAGNTKAIRRVIKQMNCQIVTGATLANPHQDAFQLGRIFITPQTDTTAMRRLLEKAYRRKAFVVFGTHASSPIQFSEERTRQVLKMAKELGFDFNNNSRNIWLNNIK